MCDCFFFACVFSNFLFLTGWEFGLIPYTYLYFWGCQTICITGCLDKLILLMGGPPCQVWSASAMLFHSIQRAKTRLPSSQGFSGMNPVNQRSWSKVQCEMIPAFLSFADYFRPRFFLLENVRIFMSFNKGQAFWQTLVS